MAASADFQVSDELTVHRLKAFGETLLASVHVGGDVRLDLSRVQHMDTAGLQLLLQAHRQAVASGGTLSLEHPASIVTETFQFCGLGQMIEPTA